MTEPRKDTLEPGSVATWKVVAFSAGFWALMGLSAGGLYAVFAALAPANRTPELQQFPQPRLEAHPAQDLNALLDQQRKALSGYRWADSGRTMITIPIERAMEIIAGRGEQAYAPLDTAPPPAAPEGKP